MNNNLLRLLEKLDRIANHDWRVSFIANTSDTAAEAASLLKSLLRPRPLSEWHEGMGPALWWILPIEEEPYVGSPLDTDWPEAHTHWTPLISPLNYNA